MAKTNLQLVAIRLPAVFWDELKKIAENEFTTPSAIIRKVLGDYLKTTKESKGEKK